MSLFAEERKVTMKDANVKSWPLEDPLPTTEKTPLELMTLIAMSVLVKVSSLSFK
jgi:hypothetical protein